mmetsp:Transcript_5338/g.7878  ORF Transcript_5338/g.7878 Transcript_5338/m.7878 type:complete len:86 (+) Transcript_5338:1172-1429(+)
MFYGVCVAFSTASFFSSLAVLSVHFSWLTLRGIVCEQAHVLRTWCPSCAPMPSVRCGTSPLFPVAVVAKCECASCTVRYKVIVNI